MGDPIMPVQGPQYFDALRTAWWYNYTPRLESYQVPGLVLFWPGYQRLYMFWRSVATTSDTEIQNYARAAKAADPTRTVWWAMSNEPNDRGQANQAGASFAAIYLKHHKNLRIGDPTCKIMGPGILNWTFQSNSVYQTGKAWYEEFRSAWAADAACAAYSQSVNGTNYPPQDAFCMHSYDLRGQSPVPYAPDDWRWCRDQMVACHTDLQLYPETQGLKIWNTEFGGLMGPTTAQCADMESGLVLWMREQPWIERWFLFFTHSDKNGSWPLLHLFDDSGSPTQLGKLYKDLSLLPADASFYHYPYHTTYSSAADYVRPGWTRASSIGESLNAPGVKLYLNQNNTYAANTMRGRTFAPSSGRVYRVRFNYQAHYDNSMCVLAMDTPSQPNLWQANTFGLSTDYVDIDLSSDPPPSVSFALCVGNGLTYTYATEEWHGIIANVMLLTCPDPPTVSDEGAMTLSPNSLSVQWSTPAGGKQPVVEYEYAIGTSLKGTDTVGWTSAGTSHSVTRTGLTLADDTTYYISVRARDSDGHWGAVGCSDGITKIALYDRVFEAKHAAVGSQVGLAGLVVSAVFPDKFYAQQEDRSAGIGIVGTSEVAEGDRVSVAGQLQVVDGEAILAGSAIAHVPGTTPAALGVSNRSSGGGQCGAQPALMDQAPSSPSTGISNVGLLVKLWGRVTHVDTTLGLIYVDDGSGVHDGSGHAGVRVDLGTAPLPYVDGFAAVTGIQSATTIGGNPARLIRPRGPGDVAYDRTMPSLTNAGFESGQFPPWVRSATGGSIRSGTWYYSISACSGSCFFGVYGNNATRSGVLTQTVDLSAGSYRASVQSRVLHGNNAEDAARNRIGIDPTGATDPAAASVQWSEWDTQSQWYTSEWRLLTTPSVSTAGGPATVFLEYSQQDTSGWHTNCFDDAVLTAD